MNISTPYYHANTNPWNPWIHYAQERWRNFFLSFELEKRKKREEITRSIMEIFRRMTFSFFLSFFLQGNFSSIFFFFCNDPRAQHEYTNRINTREMYFCNIHENFSSRSYTYVCICCFYLLDLITLNGRKNF